MAAVGSVCGGRVNVEFISTVVCCCVVVCCCESGGVIEPVPCVRSIGRRRIDGTRIAITEVFFGIGNVSNVNSNVFSFYFVVLNYLFFLFSKLFLKQPRG